MPRNPAPRQPQGPTLSPEQARIQLERCLKRANELSKEQPLTEQRYLVWQTNTFGVLREAFGEESGHPYNFIGQGRISVGDEPEYYLEAERRKRLEEQIRLLEAVIEEFPTVQAQNTDSDFFNDLDSDIRRVSERLFKNGHHAEAVSNAFKELNHHVKQEYKKRKN